MSYPHEAWSQAHNTNDNTGTRLRHVVGGGLINLSCKGKKNDLGREFL